MGIHPSAMVSPKAQIGSNVKIGAFCDIQDNVTIDDDCQIHSHVVIHGTTHIGKRNSIYPFSFIGAPAQFQKLDHNDSSYSLKIGDDNVIRESGKICRGSAAGSGQTIIGNNNYFMGNVHIPHDAKVGNHCVIANNSVFGGHVEIGDHVNASGHTRVHQFCRIGSYSYLGSSPGIRKDVPPFIKISGQPVIVYGINSPVLRHLSSETRLALKQIFKIFYQKYSISENAYADEQTKVLYKKFPEVAYFVDFIKTSKRGIHRAMPSSPKGPT